MPRKDLKNYWPDRLQERLDRNQNLTNKETEKALHKIYQAQSNDLQLEIVKVLEKIERDLGTNEGIMPNDIYRNNRYWHLLDYMQTNLKQLGFQQLTITEKALIDLYEYSKELCGESLPPETVRNAFITPSIITAKEVVHQVWCLDGKEFSDRIWLDKEKLLQRLNKHLGDYLVQGKSPFEISQKLAEEMQVSEYNAFRICRTEGKHLQNKAKIDKFTEMGFTHGIYQGKKCCDKCKEKSGKIYTLKELETMIPVHPNCTCTFRLVV